MHMFSSFLSALLIGTILSAPTRPEVGTKKHNSVTYRHRRASSSSIGAALLRKRPNTSSNNARSPYGTGNGPYLPVGTGMNNSANLFASGYIESSAANPNYWISDRYHGDIVCLLAAFSGTVRVRPSNSSFRGGVFHVSPEVSLGRRANCERNSRHIFWKFSQHDERLLKLDADDEEDTENGIEDSSSSPSSNDSSSSSSTARPGRRPVLPLRFVPIEISNRQLSVGFHIVGSSIEFHVAYIECLQPAEKNLATQRFRVHSDPLCVNLSVSFDLGSFGDRAGFECRHIWGKTLKDVHYTRDRKFYAGEAQISLESVRIDRDPILSSSVGGYAFRKNRRRCLADSLLSWQSLAITGSLFVVFLIGFFGLCVCSNSSCSDDLSPGSYSSDTGCCYSTGSSNNSICSILSRLLCFCFNRGRRLSTRRCHGQNRELLNHSTYDRDLLGGSSKGENHNHITQHDGHQCQAHHNHHHSTIGGHHQRHYSNHNHRHVRRPAPPPLLPPPPPPPPSSSSTGTTHVDSEILVLPVGHSSECKVLLELIDDEDENIIEFDNNCECIDDKLIVLQSVSTPKQPLTLPIKTNQMHITEETIIQTQSPPSEVMFHYFCACFLLSVSLIQQYANLSFNPVQYHKHIYIKTFAQTDVNSLPLVSPIRFSLSNSKFRLHNGSNDHVRGLN